MRQADLETKRVETYWKLMDAKKGKKKKAKATVAKKTVTGKKKGKKWIIMKYSIILN